MSAIDRGGVRGITIFLEDLVRRSRTPGLQYLVVDRAAPRFEYCGGTADLATGAPMLAATTMMAYSMSKTITAAAVLQLVDTKTIGLDDPMSRYVATPYGDAITIRQLLAHTSGIPNPIPLRWVHPVSNHATFDEVAALDRVMRKHPRLAFSPGARYAYSNVGYWLLGRIVERATGNPFTESVTTRILRPLDIPPDEMAYAIADPAAHASGYLEKYSFMNLVKSLVIDRELLGEYDGRWLHIRNHYVDGAAFGGLVGSVRGFGTFLRDQLGEQSRLFGDATRRLFFEPQRTSHGPIAMTPGWHIGSREGVSFFFKEGGGGGFHCMMRLYPSNGIGTVIMTNATTLNVRHVLDGVDRWWFRDNGIRR